MDSSCVRMCVRRDRTLAKIDELEDKIRALEEKIAAGVEDPAPIAPGAVEHEQVVYSTWVEKPEIAIGPVRKMPEEVRCQIKEGESAAQLAFWKANLKALKGKEKVQLEYIQGLSATSADFQSSVFDERTLVGSGHSDYTFSY